MLQKIEAFIRDARRSPQFQNVISEPGAPAQPGDLGRLRDRLARSLTSDASIGPLLDFYRRHDGLTLRWEYSQLTHPDYITAGNTSIPNIARLLARLEGAPEGPIPFDSISDLRQVLLRLSRGRLELRYHDADSGKDHALRLELGQYFRLLDECRGLRPWQEVVIDAVSFKLDATLRKKFFADLQLLFADADPRLFETR
jgi:hypothetical protein